MSALPAHLDVYLIRILYLLLSEKSVSRVALKLNKSQPSISASLRELRGLTGDPLLVRGAQGMVPTQHGASLLLPAQQILEQTAALFERKLAFDARHAGRTFHIAAPDYLDSRFLPHAVAALRRESPNSSLVIHSMRPDVDYLRQLSDGNLDLLVANCDDPPEHLHLSTLFEDSVACFMRADCAYAKRTAADAMTVKDYLSLPHVAPTQMLAGHHGVIEDFLASQNMRRNVVVQSAYFGLIPTMLAHTDLVLTTGQQYLRAYQKNLALKMYTVPIKFPAMRFYLLWHPRVHQAPEHKWLRELLSNTAKSLRGEDA